MNTKGISYSRIHITLSDYMRTQAQMKSDQMFAGNMSAYIAYCIAKDIEQNTIPAPQISQDTTVGTNTTGNKNKTRTNKRNKK